MRLAAFAFTELAEVSSTLASLGEARSERARRTYLDLVRSSITAAEGRLLLADGDGVLAEFDSASAALAFAATVKRRCERESRRCGEHLYVRIALDVGEGVSEEAPDALTIGAAGRVRKLARMADSHTTLATSTVAAVATATDADFRSAGLIELPGWPEPVSIVEVGFPSGGGDQQPLPAELESRGRHGPFVGRILEHSRLESIWKAAVTGERQLAFVIGEPGIGKTRLVAEFARELHEQGAEVLWGRSFEEALTPYQPFVQGLQHHIRWSSAEELREQLGDDAAVLARLVPELQTRIPVADAAAQDPDSERFRLFEAIGRLLACAERPVLFVLDDLQWADQGTLLLLRHLATDAARTRLLLLGTYRHSEVGPEHPLALVQADIERDRIVDRIELCGLAEGEVGTLVGALIGWQPPELVIRALRGETQGNPLFLEEVVRHLQELGLSADPERFGQLRGTARELGVPARVRALVARRVQRLSRRAREALSAASVIGSEFGTDVLAQILGHPDPLELVATLDEAVAARLLVESAEHIGHYGFSHALIQQALYDEQTRNRRAALHERAARALESLHGDIESRHAELAYHYARAGDEHAAQVVLHGRAAAERAVRTFAYEDAVRNTTAALAALGLLPDDRDRERAELLALLGLANTRAGDFQAARAAYHDAAELAAAINAWPLLAEAVLGYGGGAGFGGVWVKFAAIDDELVRLLELALDACPPGDSPERVRLLGRLAQALYWSADSDRVLALSEEALAMARRGGDGAAVAYALDSRHVALWGPDHLEAERELAEEMLAIGRRLGDRDIQLEGLAWMITDTLETDPLDVVEGYIAEHARIASELRQPYHLWYTEATKAMLAHLEGRFAEALECVEKALTYGRDSHGENAVQTYLVQSLFIKLDMGALDDLIDGLEKHVATSPLPAWHSALAIAQAGLDRRDKALAEVRWFAQDGLDSMRRDCVWETSMTALGRTVAHFGDATYADEMYRMLLPFAGRTAVVGGGVLCLGPISRVVGMLARAAGRPDDAIEHLERALESSRALRSAPLVARTQLELAKAYSMRGGDDDLATAERFLDEAASVAASVGMGKLLHDIDVVRRGGVVGVS
jgi:tetratricopeptide (TPR) repeat protein